MKTVLLLLMLIATTPVVAGPVQTEAELRDECSGDPGGEAGMHDCLAAKAKASAAELRDAESLMRAAMPKVDVWRRFVAEAKIAFRQANHEFVRYRAVQCNFNMTLAGGAAGTSRDNMRLACITELNRQRVVKLRAQVDWFSVRE
jgi:Lysozyme inhibitor LprI